MHTEPFTSGNYYHIFNRGVNGQDLFKEKKNYYYFLQQYQFYCADVLETYAYALLKNHFHLLVRIKEKEEIIATDLTYNTTTQPKVIEPYRQFSHLFNAYTQAINKRHHRTGSLFEKKYERKLVTTEEYFHQLIFYIHNNPVHHGLVKQMSLYPWSSYETMLSEKPTMLQRNKVIDFFFGKENYIYYHANQKNANEIQDLIIE